MLEEGVIAEEGSYAELMEKDGKFANLVRKQINTAKEKAAGKK